MTLCVVVVYGFPLVSLSLCLSPQVVPSLNVPPVGLCSIIDVVSAVPTVVNAFGKWNPVLRLRAVDGYGVGVANLVISVTPINSLVPGFFPHVPSGIVSSEQSVEVCRGVCACLHVCMFACNNCSWPFRSWLVRRRPLT